MAATRRIHLHYYPLLRRYKSPILRQTSRNQLLHCDIMPLRNHAITSTQPWESEMHGVASPLTPRTYTTIQEAKNPRLSLHAEAAPTSPKTFQIAESSFQYSQTSDGSSCLGFGTFVELLTGRAIHVYEQNMVRLKFSYTSELTM